MHKQAYSDKKVYEPRENKGFRWGFWLGFIGLTVCAAKPSKQPNGTPAEELLKYNKLPESGALTEEEFNIHKEKLLKRL